MLPNSGCTPMSRGHDSGIAILNPISAGHDTAPPSSRALQLKTTGVAGGGSPFPASDRISLLPTMLIHLTNCWLLPRESLQLALTNHLMSQEVQTFYRVRLRFPVLIQRPSAMENCRYTVNILPKFIGLASAGEMTFQKCLSQNTGGLSVEANSCAILQILRTCQFETKDLDLLREVTFGVALGLGGNVMTEANRNALLTCILRSSGKCGPAQMGSMLQGLCLAFGGPNMRDGLLHAVLAGILGSYGTSSASQMGSMFMGVCNALGRKNKTRTLLNALIGAILSSCKTSTPVQMGAMMHGVCLVFGEKHMTVQNRDLVIASIAASLESSSREQIGEMTHHVCLALGGQEISPAIRDGLMQAILLAGTGVRRQITLTAMLRGFCRGLGERTISPANLDGILTIILDAWHMLDCREIGVGISSLCLELGAENMSRDCRDKVAARILASCTTSKPNQMGAMIWGLIYVLGGSFADGRIIITHDNLNAVIRQILQSHTTSSPLQMGTMINYLYRTLGNDQITTLHRGMLLARIRESGRQPEIVAAIKLMRSGQAVVDFLHLDTPKV